MLTTRETASNLDTSVTLITLKFKIIMTPLKKIGTDVKYI